MRRPTAYQNIPVAIYLLATGAMWKGIALIAFGALVIGLVDNLVRPALVGKDTKMPDYVVLISALSGLELFGLNGFVIGPVIAATFIPVLGDFFGIEAVCVGAVVTFWTVDEIAVFHAGCCECERLENGIGPAIRDSGALRN